jgi:calcineurin-like phosphoesterase family protein
MKLYIADPHFFHKNLNTRLDKRGFSSMEEMNNFMIKQWNSKVKPNDEVIVLGDLSFGNGVQTNRILKQLNGKIFLIEGNHDHQFLKDPKFDKSLIGWVKKYEEINDNGRRVVLCHYPVLFYNKQYQTDKDGLTKTYMLSGHIHDTHDMRLLEQVKTLFETNTFYRENGEPFKVPFNIINCFCMYSNYIPLTLDEWIQKSKKLAI